MRYLKSGKFKEAIADFDKFLELRPKFAPDHWRRGIALYYAGKFDDGRKQFDLHRTVNPEDVENSAWHYLCNARANTPKKAREDLIPVSKDTRVPMKQVLELFAGKIKPQDVLDAAENSQAEGRGAHGGSLLCQPVRRALLRERGRCEEGARTPHDRGGETQDRPLHVGRRRGTPEGAEGEKELAEELPKSGDSTVLILPWPQ